MAISRERRAFLKDQTRLFAAGVIESLEVIASGRFDDLDISAEEMIVLEDEKRAIADRIWKASRSPAPAPNMLPPVTAEQGVKAELIAIRKSIRNAIGAIESNQVADKDVHGTLNGVLKRLDALAHQPLSVPEGWQPIETAPRDGTVVDLWSGTFQERIADAKWDKGFWKIWSADGFGSFGWVRVQSAQGLTHWQPLPAAPKCTGGGETE